MILMTMKMIITILKEQLEHKRGKKENLDMMEKGDIEEKREKLDQKVLQEQPDKKENLDLMVTEDTEEDLE